MSLELLCVAQGCLKKDTQVAKVSKRNLVVIILNLNLLNSNHNGKNNFFARNWKTLIAEPPLFYQHVP